MTGIRRPTPSDSQVPGNNWSWSWAALRFPVAFASTVIVGARSRRSIRLNWFTEGFDTVDLKEAKTLLDELS